MSLVLKCAWCEEEGTFGSPRDADSCGWFLYLPPGEDQYNLDNWEVYDSVECWLAAQ